MDALLAAARAHFRLNRRHGNASTRDHLERVARKLGQQPAELQAPKIPPALAHVWEWFVELDAARGSTGWGPAPLSFLEIKAWSDLTGSSPHPHEIRLIRQLDHLLFEVMAPREK